MMVFNYNKLRGRIREKYITEDAFAKALSIGRTSLSHRLTGKLEFSQKEMNRAANLLEFPTEEIPIYFFTEEV